MCTAYTLLFLFNFIPTTLPNMLQHIHIMKPTLLLSIFFTYVNFFAVQNAFAQQNKTHQIASPNGLISVQVYSNHTELYYKVQYKKQPIINESTLGIVYNTPNVKDDGIVLINSKKSTFSQTWKPVWGYNSSILNQYNQLTVNCETPKGNMQVVFRVYNTGLGFRYEVNNKKSTVSTEYETEILGEKTQFSIAQNGTAYWQPIQPNAYEEHFEMLHKITPITTVDSANTPLTIKLNNGVHVSIHEAALINYSSTILVNTQHTNTLNSFLAPWQGSKVAVKLKNNQFNTPWRTIQISPNAAELINGAQLILNLNEPCKLQDVSWIKPMKFNGVWWEMHLDVKSWMQGPYHGATTANTKKYIDFAAKHGLQATLAEGWNTGWETFIGKELFSYTQAVPDFDLPYLATYSNNKGVQLMSHHETGNNLPDFENQMENAYAQMKNLKQYSVKGGYVGNSAVLGKDYWHQSQLMVQHIQLSTQTAAKYQVCIDPHETIKPTGICRTYPNLMSGEGVRGNEFNAWSEGNPPQHEIVLAFTRGLAGPMDYTPGIFDPLYTRGKAIRASGNSKNTGALTTRVHTTLSKQLALFVCLYSPIVMAADLVENYEGHPAFQFITDVPTTFDETKVLQADIPNYYTVARRNGTSWYVGGITNEIPRTLQVNCNFLQSGKKYKAIIYADSKQTNYDTAPEKYEIKTQTVTNKTVLNIPVTKSGGLAISMVIIK